MNDKPEDGTAECPVCKTGLDPSTGLCLCPKTSAEPAPPLNFSSGALVAQAESLFETYLAARLVRARRNLTMAKVALLRDPRSRGKLEDMRRAETEAERLQSQLVEQARKAAHAREGRRDSVSAPASQASVMSAEATDDFRAAQVVRAEEAYQISEAQLGRRSRPDDRDCPKCGSRVSGELTVCTCGHQFAVGGSDVVAEPFLTDEDLAGLRSSPKMQKRAE